MWHMRSSSGDCPLEAGVELEWFPASNLAIWLYAGSLACARTDGASVSSGGRDTFDSDSMLVTPWLAHLGVHRPRRRGPSLPRLAPLYSFLAVTQLSVCMCLIRESCIVFTVVLLTCCVNVNTTALYDRRYCYCPPSFSQHTNTYNANSSTCRPNAVLAVSFRVVSYW